MDNHQYDGDSSQQEILDSIKFINSFLEKFQGLQQKVNHKKKYIEKKISKAIYPPFTNFDIKEEIINQDQQRKMTTIENNPSNFQRIQQEIQQDKQNKEVHKNIYQIKKNHKEHGRVFVPQQRIYYHRRVIKVMSGSINKIKRQILVVPFYSLALIEAPSNFIAEKLHINIFKYLKTRNEQQQIKDGEILSIPSDGFPNYQRLFFMKIPHKHCLRYYSIGILQESIQNIFQLLYKFHCQSIVFPTFYWGCLQLSETAQIVLNQIMAQIRKFNISKLREISIVLNQKQSYLTFSDQLRKISDEYVKSGQQIM